MARASARLRPLFQLVSKAGANSASEKVAAAGNHLLSRMDPGRDLLGADWGAGTPHTGARGAHGWV